MPNFDFDCLNPHQLQLVRALAHGCEIRFTGDPTEDDGHLYINDAADPILFTQDDLEVVEEAGFQLNRYQHINRYQHNLNAPWRAVFRPIAREKILAALRDFDLAALRDFEGAAPVAKSHEEALRLIIAAIDNGEAKAYIRSTAERALDLPAPEPAKVVITVDGGVVQCIDANTASLKAIVIDYDNEGGDIKLVTVPHLANDDPDAKDGENDAAIFEFTHEVMPESFFTDVQRAATEYHEANDLAAEESNRHRHKCDVRIRVVSRRYF